MIIALLIPGDMRREVRACRKPRREEEAVLVCSPSAGLNSRSVASSAPSSLLSLMLSTSHQKSSMEVLSMEACELERLNAGGGADSLESILLILRQRGRDFLKRERGDNTNIHHAHLYHAGRATRELRP